MTDTAPLTDQQLADIRRHLGDAKPATNALIVDLARSITDRRTHDHPKHNEDWFCANLAGWAGDRIGVVLRRLVGAEEELARLRAALSSIESDAERAARKGYDLDAEDIRAAAHKALTAAAPSA